MVDPLKVHADGLTLVYHEARHVRFLIKRGYLTVTGWEKLVSLPRNRVDAWNQLQPLRQASRAKPTTFEAAELFRQDLGRSLVELLDLYANPTWKHSACGGNAWHRITQLVAGLGQAIGREDPDVIQTACASLLDGQHNNGTLREKIVGLDDRIGVAPDPWWRPPISDRVRVRE